MPEIPGESLLHTLLLVLLAAVAVMDRPVLPIATFLTLCALMCATDWTRFRPWVYQNCFLLSALAICYWGDSTPGLQREALNICRLITASIYFWAGALKLNRTFVTITFPWVVSALLPRLPVKVRAWLPCFGPAVPFLEAGLGLGLLFPSSRPLALVAALTMHGFILTCFSPLGHRNYRSIRPWNVGMLLTSGVIFWQTEVGIHDIVLGQASAFHLLVLGLFTVLPVLGLFNLLDPVFSHGHMSGRHVFGYIGVSPRLFKKLPASIQACCGRLGGVYILDVLQWYHRELEVPAPQQERLLKAIARQVGRYGASDRDLQLTVCRMPAFRSTAGPRKTWSWSQLVAQSR